MRVSLIVVSPSMYVDIFLSYLYIFIDIICKSRCLTWCDTSFSALFGGFGCVSTDLFLLTFDICWCLLDVTALSLCYFSLFRFVLTLSTAGRLFFSFVPIAASVLCRFLVCVPTSRSSSSSLIRFFISVLCCICDFLRNFESIS